MTMNKFWDWENVSDADALRGKWPGGSFRNPDPGYGYSWESIFFGCVSAYVHNRLSSIQNLTMHSRFYGGARFVFIVLIPVIIILAVVLTYAWPPVQMVIDSLGYFINRTGNFGIFIYGALERLLIPTGLHHLVYTPFLYTKLGGQNRSQARYTKDAGNIYYAEMADPSYFNFIVFCSMGWGLSVKMFGPVGVPVKCTTQQDLKNRQEDPKQFWSRQHLHLLLPVKQNRLNSLFPACSADLICSRAVLGTGMVAFNIKLPRHRPNGFIDFLYNIPLGIGKTHWPTYL